MLLNVARRLIDVDMKLVVVWLLMSGAALAAGTSRSQTLSGAYQRARERLQYLDRNTEELRQNRGATGRRNAIRDEQQQCVLPWLQPKPLTGW
jgi:hypothetical protein